MIQWNDIPQDVRLAFCNTVIDSANAMSESVRVPMSTLLKALEVAWPIVARTADPDSLADTASALLLEINNLNLHHTGDILDDERIEKLGEAVSNMNLAIYAFRERKERLANNS